MTMSAANAAGHPAPCTSDVMNKAGMHVAKVSNNCVMSKPIFRSIIYNTQDKRSNFWEKLLCVYGGGGGRL